MNECHRRRFVAMLLGLLAASLLLTTPGCTRRFYRKWVDTESEAILAEKDRYPDWKIEQYHVYPDPRARYADPTNPDRPPMPPDDPAAWQSSPHPQRPGHPGVAWYEGTAYLEVLRRWDEENRAKVAEEAKAKDDAVRPASHVAEPESPAPSNPTGPEGPGCAAPGAFKMQPFLITLEQCVEMGGINSREFQSFREDLYLASLPVAQQRFSFAGQWTAIENAVRQWAGPQSLEGPQNNWTLTSTAGLSKLFSTGALLTLSFANTTVFNFLDFAHGTTSQSTINLDIVQPLLRGGGRAVTLEPLTQAERNLVYDIRSYARFREQFYVAIAYGGSLPSSLASAAGTTGTFVGSPISTLAALGIASTDVQGQFRGFLPTLFRELDMAVDQKLVTNLERGLQLFEGFQEGGDVSPLQVDQVRSQLLNARATVLKDIQDTTNAMDQLKQQLGLPVNVELVLDDTLAKPITAQMARYEEVIAQADTAFALVDKQDRLSPSDLRAFLRRMFTTDPLVAGTPFQKEILPAWDRLIKGGDKELQQRLIELGRQRRKLLDLKTDLETKGKTLSAEDEARLQALDFESDLAGLEEVLRRYEAQPWAKLTKDDLRRRGRETLFRIVARSAQAVLVWPRNERLAQLRERWPALPATPLGDLDLGTMEATAAQQAAVQAALQNRWDLMNQRAQVVDTWRQLKVTANALMGIFNVQYHLDSTTPVGGSRPLAFSSAATDQKLILNAQLPLVRMTERNNYRTALINYQRSRRSLMSLEDSIAAQTRFDVRQLQLFAENYRIQKKLIELQYSLLENSLAVLLAPPDVGAATAGGAAGTSSGAGNAAALTNQYLQALSGLNQAQTRMYDVWLSYLATRMQLYLDLEQLRLDNRGAWIDESTTRSGPESSASGAAAPDLRPDTGEPLPPPRLLPPSEVTPVEPGP